MTPSNAVLKLNDLEGWVCWGRGVIYPIENGPDNYGIQSKSNRDRIWNIQA